ncbi:gamma-glutamylcyclotransferase family protein [Haloarcula onubensis]|uniref:Gamma-glutamylcyclotransferase n=1 Tax=Haloarcula onubensis TaxID=2950539 RepID=A0ABU2FV56_9EURY|nr:gamma-glutamylcyclotransferase family protein [Halomicroarcula sp. S3CR25-11]MDS0284649.1 gamma-glutamylcyclotransferase [Halomicroarcula sp. S3CR25-11]
MEVFVYGTLTDPSTAARVLDRYEFRAGATLEGLHRVDGEYPTLAPGGTCDGRILSTVEGDRLDRYEGVDRGLYVRRSLPVDGGGAVECYVGNPAALGVAAEWPGAGSFADRVDRFLETNDVVVTTG